MKALLFPFKLDSHVKARNRLIYEALRQHSSVIVMVDVTGRLTQIFVYPIKSCAGLALPNATLTPIGLQHDRQWLIVDGDGQFQTQRQIPHLAWIEPAVTDGMLQLTAPDLPTITVPFAQPDAQKLSINIWRDRVLALDMGDLASQWLDEFLQVPGRHFRLVQFAPDQSRLSDPYWCGNTPAGLQFADGFAVNVVSEASVRHFNERLMAAGLEPVDMRRFRPNLVVEGLDPHDEDRLGTMSFSGNGQTLNLDLVKPCPRCQIPNINPDTAISEPEITQTLSRYRQMPSMDHAICFGINAVVRSAANGELAVGMAFEADFRFEEGQ